MKIKYVGTRPFLSTSALRGGRANYYFGVENDFTVDTETNEHASELLGSQRHSFIVVPDNPVIVPKESAPEEKAGIPEEPVIAKPKKRGRKKHV